MTSHQREGSVMRRALDLQGRRTSLTEGVQTRCRLVIVGGQTQVDVTKNRRLMRTSVNSRSGSRMQMVFSHVPHHERRRPSDQCSVGEFHWQFRVVGVSGFCSVCSPNGLSHEICPRVCEGSFPVSDAHRIGGDRRGTQSQCDITDLSRVEILPAASTITSPQTPTGGARSRRLSCTAAFRCSGVASGIHCWPMVESPAT